MEDLRFVIDEQALRNLSIVMANDEPEEVTDSIADAAQVIVIVERPLQDGFQYTDLFQWVAVQPYIQEIVNDAQTFWKQFNEIVAKNPKLAIASVVEARRRVEGSGLTNGAKLFFNFLFLAANGFDFGSMVFIQSQAQITMWQNFFKGVDIMPNAIPTAIGPGNLAG